MMQIFGSDNHILAHLFDQLSDRQSVTSVSQLFEVHNHYGPAAVITRDVAPTPLFFRGAAARHTQSVTRLTPSPQSQRQQPALPCADEGEMMRHKARYATYACSGGHGQEWEHHRSSFRSCTFIQRFYWQAKGKGVKGGRGRGAKQLHAHRVTAALANSSHFCRTRACGHRHRWQRPKHP